MAAAKCESSARVDIRDNRTGGEDEAPVSLHVLQESASHLSRSCWEPRGLAVSTVSLAAHG